MQIKRISISFSGMHMQICEFSALNNSKVSYVCLDTSFFFTISNLFSLTPFFSFTLHLLSLRVCTGEMPCHQDYQGVLRVFQGKIVRLVGMSAQLGINSQYIEEN